MNQTRCVRAAVTLAAALLAVPLIPDAVGDAAAQTFPSRPVRIIVPFAPGGGNDAFARHLAAQMSDTLKQQVIVENRAGAGGTIGSDIAAKAAPDGYTLLLGHTGTLAINPALYPKLPYDGRTAFVAVGPLASAPLVLVVPASSPIRSLTDLIARARAEPGKLSYASSGSGTGGHLGGKLLEQMTGVSLLHVPYKGTAPALTDVLGGQVDLMFSVFPPAVPHIDGGKLRAIAVTGAHRSERLPQVPTVSESGVKGYENTLAYGLMAPRGTPEPVIRTLAGAMASALDSPKLREAFRQEGAEPLGGTAAEFEALVRREMDKWASVIKAGGVKVE